MQTTTVWVGVHVSQELYDRFLKSLPEYAGEGLPMEPVRVNGQIIGFGYVMKRIGKGRSVELTAWEIEFPTTQARDFFHEHHLPWNVELHVQPTDDHSLHLV